MAKLLFTTTAFKPTGTATPGVPMLFDRHMRLIEPACSWFLHVALVRGRTRSCETWRTYAEALYDWWQTLEAMDWRWDNVTPLHVAAYRDRMLSGPSIHTQRPYARSTINARVRILAMFYAWGVRAKLLAKSPFLEVDMRVRRPDRNNMLAHLDVSGGIQKVNELALRHTPGLPRPLGIEELRRIASELSIRDRLIVEWGLTTGARRMEVAALGVRALLQSSSDDAMPPIRLTRTKGDTPRLIYPPLQLVDRTRAYMREERAALVARIKRKRTSWTEPDTVFITTKGRRMTPRSVGAMFVAAARKSQVHATFHSLRHTYAVTMLALLQRHARSSESLNPLLTLQVLLGHANISSTSVYLRVLATDMAEVERSVDELYEALR